MAVLVRRDQKRKEGSIGKKQEITNEVSTLEIWSWNHYQRVNQIARRKRYILRMEIQVMKIGLISDRFREIIIIKKKMAIQLILNMNRLIQN